MPKNELFIGSLSRDCRRQDLEEAFNKYGKLIRCDIKYSNAYSETAYGFVGFEDERDAEDALKNENGRKICGQPIVIEYAKTKPWNKKDDTSGESVQRSRHRSHSRSPSYSVRSRSRSTGHRRKRHHRRRWRRRHRTRSPSTSASSLESSTVSYTTSSDSGSDTDTTYYTSTSCSRSYSRGRHRRSNRRRHYHQRHRGRRNRRRSRSRSRSSRHRHRQRKNRSGDSSRSKSRSSWTRSRSPCRSTSHRHSVPTNEESKSYNIGNKMKTSTTIDEEKTQIQQPVHQQPHDLCQERETRNRSSSDELTISGMLDDAATAHNDQNEALSENATAVDLEQDDTIGLRAGVVVHLANGSSNLKNEDDEDDGGNE